ALNLTVLPPGIGPSETLGVDRGAAPAAALVISAEDIGGLPGAPDTRGHAHWGIFISPHDFSRNIHHAFHPGHADSFDRVAWVNACDKTRLRAVFISDACHIVLVYQCRTDGAVRTRKYALEGFVAAILLPLFVEDIGA